MLSSQAAIHMFCSEIGESCSFTICGLEGIVYVCFGSRFTTKQRGCLHRQQMKLVCSRLTPVRNQCFKVLFTVNVTPGTDWWLM